MAYTPPGVTTDVEIANNIVQLPGGTRITSIIGTGKGTKDVTGETVFQPISRISANLFQPGITSIDSIYDFTGSGGAKVVYPSTGTGAFGGGYFLSGSKVVWAVAQNPYPASTTPPVGQTYTANYDYTGTSVFAGTGITSIGVSSQVNAATFSGTGASAALVVPNLTTINAVYSGSDISGAPLGQYGASFEGTGTGWLQSGNSLYWYNGELSNFGTASTAELIPASGETYYVDYSYTGIATSATMTQVNAHTNLIVHTGNLALGSTFVEAINSVTGVSTTSGYPASGTATGQDSLGFAKDGSGWLLTGTEAGAEFVEWAAVDTDAYSYSRATTPPISGNYFVSYKVAKSGVDYQPKNFVDYSLVVSEYGNEAIWNYVASGSNAGTYTFNRLNPVTLAARLAFANGASIVNITQMSGLGNTLGDFNSAFEKLQNVTTDLVVPLTVGSGSTVDEISTSTTSEILVAALQHCQTMSQPNVKKERISIGSLGVADVGDADTENTYVFTAQSVLNDKRATLVAPGKVTVQIQDPTGKFQNIEVNSAFMATAIAALSANPLSDVATPLTNQRLAGFIDISSETANHPDPKYLEIEKDILGGAGVLVIDRLGANIFVRHQLTTDQSNEAVGELSVVTTTDFVSQAVRFTTEQFIGKKLIPAIVVPAVKSTILATMQELAQDNIISAIGAITVAVNPSNATEILATVDYVPVFPLNRLKVTFTIRTQL